MVHLQTIKWHDLIEDPEDLPSETGYYMLSIYRASDRFTIMLYPYEGLFGEDDYVKYDSDKKVWVLEYDYDVEESLAVCAPFLKIITWAEPIKPYEKGNMVYGV